MSRESRSPRLSTVFPILGWLPSYQRAWLGRDVVAGVIVMWLLVREGMAYAQIAGEADDRRLAIDGRRSTRRSCPAGSFHARSWQA
jgi:hypothetical protein